MFVISLSRLFTPCFLGVLLNNSVSRYAPVSCPGCVGTAELLVLVCILLAGVYLSLLVGCEVQTEPLFNGRASAKFFTSPCSSGCPGWWLDPVNYSSVTTLVRGTILLSAWQYMSTEILPSSPRSSSESLIRTAPVIGNMNPSIVDPPPSQLICHQPLTYWESNPRNIWCNSNVFSPLLDLTGCLQTVQKEFILFTTTFGKPYYICFSASVSSFCGIPWCLNLHMI